MKTLFLVVNSACDIACSYCFYTTGYEKRIRSRIRPEGARGVADRIALAGFVTVILTGGDPLHSRLKSETYTLVRELKAKGLKVILNTSGAWVTDEDFEIILDLDIDRIDISIDSHDPLVHDAQRGRHADSVKMILGLIERGYMNVVTTTVVTHANAPMLKETISWLQSLGVKDVRIQRAFVPKDARMADDTAISSMKECVSELFSPHVRDYIELTACAFSNKMPCSDPVCQMGKRYFVCTANGVLTPCFHRSDLVLGNLFSDPIESIQETLRRCSSTQDVLPSCFGAHCVSLFDNSKFWRK